MRALRYSTVLAVFALASCAKATTTALPRPDTAPAKLVSFNGTVQMQGRSAHIFTVSADGYVEATLVGLGAPATTTVGLGVGTPDAVGDCSTNHTVTTAAGTAAQIIGTGLAGSLCVVIYDVGNLTGPTIYTITVASS